MAFLSGKSLAFATGESLYFMSMLSCVQWHTVTEKAKNNIKEHQDNFIKTLETFYFSVTSDLFLFHKLDLISLFGWSSWFCNTLWCDLNCDSCRMKLLLAHCIVLPCGACCVFWLGLSLTVFWVCFGPACSLFCALFCQRTVAQAQLAHAWEKWAVESRDPSGIQWSRTKTLLDHLHRR